MQGRLPVLDDDPDVRVQKEQSVTGDGKADLAFTGMLLASAAPPSAPMGQWQDRPIRQQAAKSLKRFLTASAATPASRNAFVY
jgi:hypothetical protein